MNLISLILTSSIFMLEFATSQRPCQTNLWSCSSGIATFDAIAFEMVNNTLIITYTKGCQTKSLSRTKNSKFELLIRYCEQFMSPVSTVFHTVESVRLPLNSKGTNTPSPEINGIQSFIWYIIWGTEVEEQNLV